MASVCSSESVQSVVVRRFSFHPADIFAWIIARQRSYREWRQALELNDAVLKDIGIGRGELEREYRKN